MSPRGGEREKERERGDTLSQARLQRIPQHRRLASDLRLEGVCEGSYERCRPGGEREREGTSYHRQDPFILFFDFAAFLSKCFSKHSLQALSKASRARQQRFQCLLARTNVSSSQDKHVLQPGLNIKCRKKCYWKLVIFY